MYGKLERKTEPNNNDINGFHYTAADFFYLLCQFELIKNWFTQKNSKRE